MSSTSTEHALAIPEIVHQIFLVLGPQPVKRQPEAWTRSLSDSQWQESSAFAFSDCDKQTLASAARCCKRFSELALDVLWWFQASALPLLSVLPAFKKSNCDAIGHALYGKIDAGDLERCLSYARRIRYLESYDESVKIDASVQLHISQLLGGEPLTRSLRSLSCSLSATGLLFLSPNLRTMNVIDNPKVVPYLTMSQLLKKAPLLQKFVCHDMRLISCQSSWEALSRFPRLRYLSFDDYSMLPEDWLKQLFTFENLTELCLFLGERSLHKSLPNIPHLRSLQSLMISGAESVINRILNYLSDSPLISLRVYYRARVSDLGLTDIESMWRTRLAHISRWSAGLLHLEMEGFCDGRFVSMKEPSLLEPLLAIKTMKTLVLHTPIIFDLSDAEYERVALTWPEIEQLDLSSMRLLAFGQVVTPRATLATLETFASHCPRLSHLSLLLDPSCPPPIPQFLSHRLEELKVIHGPSSEPPTTSLGNVVAKHVKALFPFCSLREYSIGKTKWGMLLSLVGDHRP